MGNIDTGRIIRNLERLIANRHRMPADAVRVATEALNQELGRYFDSVRGQRPGPAYFRIIELLESVTRPIAA